MRTVCGVVFVLGLMNLLNVIATSAYKENNWKPFWYGAAVATLAWSLLGATVTFTKFIYSADMPVIWHTGNMFIIVLSLVETDHIFAGNIPIAWFLSEGNVFMLMAHISYAILTILIVPFWVNTVSVLSIQGVIVWFYLHFRSDAAKGPGMPEHSCVRALCSTIFCSSCVLMLAYIREREKCSDFILRRIRSNKDVPRNLEAGVYVGALLEEHLGRDLAIIQNNRPSESSDEKADDKADDQENRAKEVHQQVHVDDIGSIASSDNQIGSSIAEAREKLPTAPSPSVLSTDESIVRAAKALVPSVYQKSEDCGLVQC